MKVLSGSHSGVSAGAFFLAVALSAAGCSSLSGPVAMQEEANKLKRSGADLYNEGRYREAAEQFTRSIQQRENSINACRRAGDCNRKADDVEINKERSKMYCMRSFAYMGDNQIEQALRDARTAANYDWKNARAHYSLMWIALLTGDRTAAQEEYQHVKKLGPDKKLANEADALVNSANAADRIKAFFIFQTHAGKGLKAGLERDYGKALEICRPLAEKGDAIARYCLGNMYYDGHGVEQSYADAFKWTKLAAEQGYADAQARLGFMYLTAQGIPRDYQEAAKWYGKAADQGQAGGQVGIGYMYANGQGVPRDNHEAMKWYRKAADQGYAQGQYSVGYMYYAGEFQDYQEAAAWFKKAAEQGDAAAQCCLGDIYGAGLGVPVNLAYSYMWLELAAAAGNQEALKLRGGIEKKMTPEQISKAMALVREWNKKHQAQK